MTTHREPRPGPVPFLTLLPALLLWGWQAGFLPWAAAMAVVLEAPRFVRFRIEIPQNDFNRLWNFTVLLFLGLGLYLFLAREGLNSVGMMVGNDSPRGRLDGVREISQTALIVLRCLPFVLFPFMLAFVWSRAETLPWVTFSMYEQARAARLPAAQAPEWASWRTNPAHPYVAVVLFSSCTSVAHPLAYLPAFLAVTTWVLWPWRSRRHGWIGRSMVMLGLLVLGFAAQWGMGALRGVWSSVEARLMQGTGGGTDRQLRVATALGSVGRLKQSGRIILRIQTDSKSGPGLLREAAFNRYRERIWSSTHRVFEQVGSVSEGGVWRVAPAHNSRRSLTISRYADDGDVSLSLPGDVVTVRELPQANLETNYMACARLREAPSLVRYLIDAGPGGGFDGPSEAMDTDLEHLSESDRTVITDVARQLGLPGLPPAEAVRRVEKYFREGFEYSLWQRARSDSETRGPLEIFLRETHAGHCEFFATATVLLLRTAGIPSRYAVGFSPEDRRGEDWLARGRDAHAWCLAFVDGRWVDIDTTPGIWRERESAGAGAWESVSDLFSQAWYRFSVWRQQSGEWQLPVFIAGMLGLSWMAWRQLRGSRWRRARDSGSDRAAGLVRLGMDSEFFEVMRRVEGRLGPRLEHESVGEWLRRLGLTRGESEARWREAAALHARLRFDPGGLPAPERDRLRETSRDLIRQLERAGTSPSTRP